MKPKKLNISTIAKTRWLEHAVYTLEQRAIPSMIDGLKPVQRFILYSTIKNARDRFAKVAEIASSVSGYGYHHGESSSQDAASLMGALWANNVPVLESKGSFGTRLVRKAAAARYIHAKLGKNFDLLFKDTELAPIHDDEEHIPPKFYLPIIPYVLLNGVKGIATGFATNIMPYNAVEVTKLCKDYLSGKKIDKHVLVPSFPDFDGSVAIRPEGGFEISGCYEKKSLTKLEITELPYDYDREKYVKILDDLEENGTIVSYLDKSKQKFNFIVTLRRDFKDDDIEKVFKLKSAMTENLTVIDQHGKPKVYDNPVHLIKDFCDFRLIYVQKRIDAEILALIALIELLHEKARFISLVLANKIQFKGKSKASLIQELISHKFKDEHHDALLSMNFYHLTTEKIADLKAKIEDLDKRLEYCRHTTKEKEYLIDIEQVLKSLK